MREAHNTSPLLSVRSYFESQSLSPIRVEKQHLTNSRLFSSRLFPSFPPFLFFLFQTPFPNFFKSITGFLEAKFMSFETNQQTCYPPPTTTYDFASEKSRVMATDFAMPVQQFTTSPSQYTLYNGHQISPTNITPQTPNNASPTSPRSGLPHYLQNTRQLRPPKSPLYVPAVLRPTDPPKRAMKPSLLTPPQSMHSSFDDLENATTLSRRSTGDSGKFGLGAIDESEWVEELGKVTALPTRNHWKVC